MSANTQPATPPSGRRSSKVGLLPLIALVVGGLLFVGVQRVFNADDRAPLPSVSSPPGPVDGVVVGVQSSGLGHVSGFTLRLDGGATMDFTLGTLENATQFSPSHLAEHQATSVPVRVYYLDQDGVPTVYRLEDAPG